MQQTILLAGGGGYIGSVTSRRLLAAGHKVVVLDTFEKGHRDAVPPGVEIVDGNIGDTALVTAICKRLNVTAGMHVAAYIEVGESVTNPGRYWSNNVQATMCFLDGLQDAGVRRIVFSSTAAVYGEPHHVPIDEEHPTRPTNPYGWTKLMVEHALQSRATMHGWRAVALRYFNAAGAVEDAGERHDPETHLIPLVLRAAAGRRMSISVFGTDWPTHDGTCLRDFVHVRDIADAHVRAIALLEHPASGGPGLGAASVIGKHGWFEAINLGTGTGHSVKEIIDAAHRVTKQHIVVENAPRRAGDPARLVASNQKARKLLGWNPEVNRLDDIISSAWKWEMRRTN